MNSLDAFRMWVSVRLHFTKKSWDVKTQGFSIKCSFDHLVQRPDFHIFEYIPTQFTQSEFFKYLVANSVYGFTQMLYDLPGGRHNVNVWEGNRQQLSSLLSKDLSTIDALGVGCDAYKILSLMVQQKISIESIILINIVADLTGKIRETKKGNTIIENLLIRIDKAKTFFNVSEEQKNNIEKIVKVN